MGNLVGKRAPSVRASCVCDGKIVNHFTLDQYKGKYVVLFFYPLDFTFVCPTELHAFQEELGEFEKRGCQVVGCSIDSAFSHMAWLRTPKAKGGIEGVTYPLLADLQKRVAVDYDVLSDEGIAFRGLFLIDKEGIIRHQLVNDLPLGRSVPEVLRMLDALIFYEKNGEVCPANWSKGKASMKPTEEGLSKYFAVN